MKCLAYCLDGTSNTYDAAYPTNVVMAHKSIAEEDSAGTKQIAYYDEGVGTKIGSKVSGMAVGAGLMTNILQAYEHLCRHYEVGDKIYIFGFSRGAYTARSFAGLVGMCGIISDVTDEKLDQARYLYEARLSSKEEDIEALRKWRVMNSRKVAANADDLDYRVSINSRQVPIVRITYIGVWDTVKTLGTNETKYLWHDHSLSDQVDAARHAVALDERRNKFNVTEWDNVDELNAQQNFERDDKLRPYQQIWFPGDHGSIGGGGPNRGLSDAAFEWIIEGAEQAGLEIRRDIDAQAFDILPNHLAEVFNTPAPHWTRVHKHVGRFAIKLFGRSDRTGPTHVGEVSHSALVRYFCPEEHLPERKAYRPGALKRLAKNLTIMKPMFSSADYRALRENVTKSVIANDEIKIVLIDDVRYQVHTVIRGETLSELARQYLRDGALWPEIFEANSATISDPNRIYIGQRILVPMSVQGLENSKDVA